MASKLHFIGCLLTRGADRGFALLSWTQDPTIGVPSALPEPKPKRKHTLLPVLVALFLISYGLMSLLVVEQDRTISSQRSLITSLFSDSTELSSLKGKMFQKQRAAAQAQAEAQTRSQAQTPSTQVPSTQNSLGGKNDHASKLRKAVPPAPPLGINDVMDGRRIVKTI